VSVAESELENLFGFPLAVLRLAFDNRYDQAEVAMSPFLGDDVPVAQRVMNMRLQRKFLEKQNKISEAGDMGSAEVNTAIATDDLVLISNVVAAVSLFALRHCSSEVFQKLNRIFHTKVTALNNIETPFAATSIASATAHLYSAQIRKLLRQDFNVVGPERRAIQDHLLTEVPNFLKMSPPDLLHRLQMDGVTKTPVMPFSFVLAHYEFAEFEQRLNKEHHFGKTPDQWIEIAEARALNLSDTHLATSDSDERRLNWLMFATMAPGYEGTWDGGDGLLDIVQTYRLAMILRTRMQVATDLPQRAALDGEVRALEDRFGLDWPFYEDQGIISEYF
jgi:hypothetical protein